MCDHLLGSDSQNKKVSSRIPYRVIDSFKNLKSRINFMAPQAQFPLLSCKLQKQFDLHTQEWYLKVKKL